MRKKSDDSSKLFSERLTVTAPQSLVAAIERASAPRLEDRSALKADGVEIKPSEAA
jgi:hypothetical protein